MGLLRGSGVVIVSVLLFVSILIGGICLSLTLSLSYDNVQPQAHSFFKEIVEDEIGAESITNQLTPFLETSCKTDTEIVHNFGEYTFVYPCSVIEEGYDSILNYSVDYFISNFYYKEYDCAFTECFGESDIPLFLVSNYARIFWQSLFFKALIASLVLVCLIVLLMERRINSFLLVGCLVVGGSLVVLALKKIGVFVAKLFLSPLSTAFSDGKSEFLPQIVSMFFLESSKAFLWMFILGLILIGVWFIFHLTGFGFKIKELIDKFGSKKISSNQNSGPSETLPQKNLSKSKKKL